jgi:hypothetical protein
MELWNFIARKHAREMDEAGECWPEGTDGCTCGLATRAAACHIVTTCARAGQRGCLRKPVCEPHPVLIYGQLITQEQPSKLLMLSTALIDRLNLTMRHALAPLVRTTASVCKD